MRIVLTIILVTLYLTNCGQANIDNKKKQTQQSIFVPTSSIVILPYDKTLRYIFNDCKPATLTIKDIQDIEIILKNSIEIYNLKQEKRFQEMNSKYPKDKIDKNEFVIELKKYKRQYIAVINSKGEKDVWINCFCDTMNIQWRKEIIDVEDGGNCFFNLKINLKTKKYYNFIVNGVA